MVLGRGEPRARTHTHIYSPTRSHHTHTYMHTHRHTLTHSLTHSLLTHTHTHSSLQPVRPAAADRPAAPPLGYKRAAGRENVAPRARPASQRCARTHVLCCTSLSGSDARPRWMCPCPCPRCQQELHRQSECHDAPVLSALPSSSCCQ